MAVKNPVGRVIWVCVAALLAPRLRAGTAPLLFVQTFFVTLSPIFPYEATRQVHMNKLHCTPRTSCFWLMWREEEEGRDEHNVNIS